MELRMQWQVMKGRMKEIQWRDKEEKEGENS